MTDESVDLVGFTADIVSAYLSHNPLPPSELPGLISVVDSAMRKLQAPSLEETEPLVPAVPVKKSITPDHLISLEDGRPYKTLKRHLALRGLTPDAYRAKWGLRDDYPMVAASYAARRSELAKSIGLGRKLAASKTVAAPANSRGRQKKAS